MHPTKRTGNQSALHPDSEALIGSLSAQLERLVGNSAGPTSRVLYFDDSKKKFSTKPLAECKEFKNAKLGEETHAIRVEKEVLKSLKKTLKKSLNEFSEDAQKDAINTALGSIRTLRNNRNPISVTQLEASLKPLEALPNKTYKDGLAEQFQILDIDENIQLDNIQQAVSTLAKLIEFLNNTTKFKERHENKTLTIRQGKTKDKALIFYLSDKKLNPAEKEDLRKTQNRETQQKQKANRGSNKALIFFKILPEKSQKNTPIR